jgi:hypothetical protein
MITLRRIGDIKDLFERGGSAPIPRQRRDIPAPKALEGKHSSSLELGLGLQLATDFLGALGAGTFGLKDAYKNAYKLIFSYKNILINEIDLIPLDEYINEAILNIRAKTYIDSLKKNKIYIINSVLKSNNFSIKPLDKNNAEVSINIPKLQEMVNGKVQIKIENNNESEVQFCGETPLIFAFQAVRVIYKGEKEGFRLKDRDKMILRDETDIPMVLYTSKRNFITIEDDIRDFNE